MVVGKRSGSSDSFRCMIGVIPFALEDPRDRNCWLRPFSTMNLLSRSVCFGLCLLAAALLSACNSPAAVSPTDAVESQPTATRPPTTTPELEAPQGALVSPDGNYYAVVREAGQLVIGGRDGGDRAVVSADEITGFLWLPDSRRLVYVDRSPTDSANPVLRDRLWIVDIDSAESHAISSGFAPLLSPDGRHLAFVHGSRSGDACVVGFGLGIVELNEEFVPTALVRQTQIAGIPSSEAAHSFQPDLTEDLSFPGRWRDARTLEVTMRWACRDQFGDDGVYAVDVGAYEAEPAGELDGSKTYLSADGRYSVSYPADEFALLVDQKPSVDGVIAPAPGSVSLHRTLEPSLLITIRHIQLQGQPDRYELVAAQDPCAADGASAEDRLLGSLEALLFRDTPCGPYGYSLVAATDRGYGYLVQIEARVPFDEVAEAVNAILASFETFE